MTDRDARFRRLRPTPGDLFEHFGVVIEAPAPIAVPGAPRPASACARCAWYVCADESACPVCGTPRDHGAP